MSTAAFGQTAGVSVCQNKPVAFVFFNGVLTRAVDAELALKRFKFSHGVSSRSGDAIHYELLYNHTNGFDDFVETFEQRLQEQDRLLDGRFELFFQSLSGGGTWWATITNTVSSAASLLKSISDWNQAAIMQVLTAQVASPPTIADYQEHQSRIDNFVFEGKKLLFVAHSQGNLFANSAHDYAITKVGADSVSVVHIAPASPILNGPHTLADLDLVINGLRAAGSVPPITDSIPGYLERPAGANNKKDMLGHGLLEIYINQSLAIANRTKTNINSALDVLVAPPIQAVSGFFTATLTWDGLGDVDLHTQEPDGTRVSWLNRTGSVGFLDVDNVIGFGPEHFYASCDPAKLQVGTYHLALANFSGAVGRQATVQIASAADGVLLTKTVTVGPATGSTPSIDLADVLVSRNSQTGNYSVSLSAPPQATP